MKVTPWRGVEIALWAAALALLSPLVIYLPRGAVPLPGMFTIAAGLALSLALAGRRLHGVLLEDGLRRRGTSGRTLLILALMGLIALGGFSAIVLIVSGMIRAAAGGAD